MPEQRVPLSPAATSAPMSIAPSSSTATSASTVRPVRPASTASLRHQQQQQHRTQPPASAAGSVSQSRRQSVDTFVPGSQPPSPITYFPNPSTFASGPSNNANSISSAADSTSTSPTVSVSHMASTDSDDPPAPQVVSTSGIARTPRLNPVASSNVIGLDTGAPSPRVQASRSHGGHAQTSSGTTSSTSGSLSSTIDHQSRLKGSSRVFSTPGAGYSATHPNIGLGLGPTPSRAGTGSTSTTINDAALSSPRRISTSRGLHAPPQTAAPPVGNLGLPTHEAYYSVSQPASATTPRFRDKGVYLSGGSGGPQHHSSSMAGYPSGSYGATHQNQPSRDLASTSAMGASMHSPFPSPEGSVLKRLKNKASNVGLGLGRPDNYDDEAVGRKGDEDEMLEDNEGERANGTRVWYSSFATIDWIHDAIKESSRVRRLRNAASRSLRGKIANTWDRLQGWLVVTLIGIITAFIAFLIIRAEMAFFDLKEGFCSTSWGTARRFCCAPRHQSPGSDGGEDECSDWIEWGQFFNPKERDGPFGGWVYGGPEFMAYATVALLLAVVASCMTVYLSSSAHHTTSKDSTFLTPPSTIPTAKQSAASSPTKRTASLPYGPHNERQPLLDSIANEPPTPLIESPPEPFRKVMFYAAGSGIPEIKTILSGFVIHGYLGGWTLLTKSAGLALSVGSGLSLGKEGPLVHMSSCVGNIISRMFLKFECNEAKRREILSAACAAGVAVAFGAPVGGVLFSLEEVSYYFPPKVMWRSFWCAAIAAITLKALNPFGNGSLVLFAVTYTKEYHYWEYIVFIVLGVFGGLYGAVFARLNIIWSRHVRNGTWLRRHPIFEVALVVLLTTIVSFSNPYTRMGGTELVANLFEECNSSSSSSLCVNYPHELATVIWEVFMALVIKGCLTIITFGIKVPAGIFIPSLAVGACFGRIVGHMMEYIEFTYPELSIFNVCKDTDCIVPGIYAMVGAAATLAGVTRTTVSLAVIMFELTSTLNYVVPVMLGVLIAKTVADGLEKKGIYDLVIDLNQLPYLDSKHEYLWGSRRASSVADRSVPHLRADKPHTVRSLTGKLLELVRLGMEDTGFPVLVKEVTSAGGPSTSASVGLEGGIGSGRERSCLRVVGFLGINELEHALSELADEPDAAINLIPDDASQSRVRSSAMSIFSFADSFVDNVWNPYDLSRYIDQAPITVQIHSPLELVQQLFVKLGVRQVIVVNSRGVFQGIITKKAWLNFLSELEEGTGH
ncbi:voltage-gated chloride channel [Cryptococcus neoformans C23]|uniref:Chloride channel protein n=1 Tax=Cryptococcus neoformans (strain H99 / ATCC 208821 / CBS 10515 / FGSC 9487) TaxID=235443 RepID=J9VMF5_CRYN9|nr:voltage-gated chloride channel protein [Cryptococcus neoformans var. grubii H99]AUB25495.1 voltage-gated chloride channel protein [Cryptococcus neoformans var. grubii]OWZ43171.1 voltage-gated chloride channel [Cryptococcus neoformans var. grubii C23]OXC84191.1 voltage-gated chloride channel [Cryptococcus neoformans var. grubii AD1-7a]AFR95662.2 voltage-gated chloride channel protein [Cryptococcus neoformans var. grubii H99]OXH31188.1 voltage-gated chloride channel [Cryptococcus neoformans v|eukprot:XP_012049834.1 voltage-gated chloride channel protein [Cryptococcus neoformans var. grubii H99]